ncbi:hypothetical protein SBF1_1240002 [Candidatus Desulfosporosinus infrequens]|uniref:Uncharacterized protein n=1 Tax=Candidatus Desulfosporosinus infrequens TaxID=2043169 RepID=A0A2U3K2C9_9FIRM|nr:hypothetical protein SBF1_1240002 [Candidatus Desulfosporosinus infrequens]
MLVVSANAAVVDKNVAIAAISTTDLILVFFIINNLFLILK